MQMQMQTLRGLPTAASLKRTPVAWSSIDEADPPRSPDRGLVEA